MDEVAKILAKYNCLIYDQVDNTHFEAQRLLQHQKSQPYIVWAKAQTYSLLDDHHHAPASNLCISIMQHCEINIVEQKFVQASEIFKQIIQAYLPTAEQARLLFAPHSELLFNELLFADKQLAYLVCDQLLEDDNMVSILTSIEINLFPDLATLNVDKIYLQELTTKAINLEKIWIDFVTKID